MVRRSVWGSVVGWRGVRGGASVRRLVAVGLGVAVTVGVFTPPAQAAPPAVSVARVSHVPVARDRVVPTHAVVPRTVKTVPAAPVLASAPVVVWPGAASVDVSVPRSGMVRAGTLPVWVGAAPTPGVVAPTRVRVRVLDQAASHRAGVAGLLVQVSRVDGKPGAAGVSLRVGYTGFRGAFGGDWASRLAVVQLPACGLVTPTAVACQGTRVGAANNVAGGQVSVRAVVAPVVSTFAVVAAAAAAGGTGDYRATSLSPSASWQVSEAFRVTGCDCV